MKTLVYLILTSLASGCALYEGFHLENNIACFLLAAGTWALYFWTTSRRIKRTAARRMGERVFEEHMRSNFQTRIRF